MDWKILGARIKAERKRRGLTLEALAEKAGISRNYLWELEAGRKAPALGTLRELGAALNVSIDYLLGVSSERRALQDSGADTWRDRQLERIMEVAEGLGDSELILLSDIISDLSKYLDRK